MKKDRSIQINIYNLIDEIGNPQYLNRFSQNPEYLACHVQDLKSIINFATTNYTNKLRKILNQSKQFIKAIEQVKIIDLNLTSQIQQSYPQLAYQVFKRTSQSQIDIFQHENQIFFQTILTEMKLKFIQSQGIEITEWPNYFNQIQRQLQIGTKQFCMIKLGLKQYQGVIIWQVNNVFYNDNVHDELNIYYRNQLVPWFRRQYQDIQQGQKYFLQFLEKSINYVQSTILYLKLKSTNIHKIQNQEEDIKNGVLRVDLNQSVTKNRTTKLKFNLANSNQRPAIHLLIDNEKILQFLYIQGSNEIQATVCLFFQHQGKHFIKNLKGRTLKSKLSLSFLIQICDQIIKQIDLCKKLIQTKVREYKIDLLNNDSNSKITISINNLQMIFYDQSINHNNEVMKCSIRKSIETYHNNQGLFIAHQNINQQSQYLIVVKVMDNLMLKSQHNEIGFVNLYLETFPKCEYSDLIMHLAYFHQIVTNHFNWLMKFSYLEFRKEKQQVCYFFTANIPIPKRIQNKQYKIVCRVSSDFKNVEFQLFEFILDNKGNKPTIIGPKDYYFESFFFKQSWNEYIKNRKETTTQDYLDVDQLYKATYYIMNHWDTNKRIQENPQIPKKFSLMLADE